MLKIYQFTKKHCNGNNGNSQSSETAKIILPQDSW